MSRVVLRLVLDVVLTIAGALLLLGGWFSILGGGFPEGFRVLFNFMDVGLGLWLVLLVIVAVRSRAVSAGRTYLLLLIGAVVNALVVVTVGFIQGGWAPLLVMFAIQAGLCCLIAAAVVVPLVHRFVKSPVPAGAAT